VVESDMEILFPSEYIDSATERISLYSELDNLSTEEKLQQFTEKLIDRFGPLPRQAVDLLNTLRLRLVAREFGFEKIILRNKTLIAYFVSNPESAYFQTERFTGILRYLQANPKTCRLKETNNKLMLYIQQVSTVNQGLLWLRELESAVKNL